MLTKKIFIICLLLSFSSLSFGDSKKLPSKNPLLCKDCNLIIISLTSARKRNMSMYGYKRNTTPNIDHFFENSFVFNNAFSPGSLTFTDAISLFYSLTPDVHGAFVRRQKKETSHFLKSYSSLADILGAQGYSTAAIVSDEDYDYRWGIGKTFQYYFDRSYYAENGIKFAPFTYTVGTAQLVPIATKWLEANAKKKFFLLLQGYDMHCPYTPLGKFDLLYQSPHSKDIPFTTECFMTREGMKTVKKNGQTKYLLKSFFAYLKKQEIPYYFNKEDLDYLVSRYDAEFNQADANLLPFFEKIKSLKLDKNSVIVFLSEHGDYLGENGFFMKPSPTALGNLHNANLNFPLMIKVPAQSKKFIQKQLVQTIDVTPTILELLGLAPLPKMQGQSLAGTLNTEREINDYVYGFSKRYDQPTRTEDVDSIYEMKYIQNHEWKLIASQNYKISTNKKSAMEYHLYNLKNDPNEKNDILKANSKMFHQMESIMTEKQNRYLKH